MNDLIQIHYDNADRPTVSGRELHKALGVETPYTTWVKRMCEYGFSENVDFATCFPNLESENQHGGQNKIDHQLTIPMAKELCMLQRTDKGKEMRQYFIAVEAQWNSPDAIMARALQLSTARLKEMTWLLYQKYAGMGYTSTKTHTYHGDDGTENAADPHTYWTQKGRLFIYDLLKSDDIYPLIERDAA